MKTRVILKHFVNDCILLGNLSTLKGTIRADKGTVRADHDFNAEPKFYRFFSRNI